MSTKLEPEISPLLSRVLAAQFYVAKNLTRAPAKTVRFIMDNRDYFPSINDDVLEKIKEEQKLTDDDISKEKAVVFADINLERNLEKEKKKETDKYMKTRSVNSSNRDYGRSSNIATNYPMHNEPNFYKTNHEKDIEENESQNIDNLKESLKESMKSLPKTEFPDMEKLFEKFAHFNVNLKEEEFTGSVKFS
jgi:hypothetical protein